MRCLPWVLPVLLAGPVAAQPVVVRLGTHDGFGRVVFEFQQSPSFTTERQGNSLLLHFPAGGEVPDTPGVARNIAAVTGGGGLATITMQPSARLRVVRIGKRVVVDVLDPAARVAPSRPGPPAAAKTVPQVSPAPPIHGEASRSPTPTAAIPVADKAAVAGLPPVAPATVPAQPAAPEPLPDPAPTASPAAVTTLALAASPAVPRAGPGSGGALLPFGPTVAAATFRHGDEAWVVFDDQRPIDLAALADDPAFAGAAVDLLPSATLLRLKLPATRVVQLDHRAEGWAVTAKDGPSTGAVAMPTAQPLRLLFATPMLGQVVAVPDADTGRNLLIGTMKEGGPGVPVTLNSPEFTILPSWQGIVIDPVSDRVVLRAVTEGFEVTTGSALAATFVNGAVASAAMLTRRFDFPSEPVLTLLRRLQTQVTEDGQAPAQARLNARKAAAQTMLALGLGPEAESLLHLAVTEDPRAASDPDVLGLTGIAALLSYRPAEAGGLDAPGLDGSDEVTLWRAIRTAMMDGTSVQAAQALTTSSALVVAYPTALRDRLLPLTAETMVAGGAAKAADALFASLPDEPLLAYARATRLEQRGDTAAALAAYDALATGHDRSVSAQAATRATLLRLATGAITPADAVKTLEASFNDWRGDARERDLRLKTAAVAAQAGDWRKAFGLLKETSQLFPDAAADIGARMTDMMRAFLSGPAALQIKPLDLVTLAEENAALVGQDDKSGMASLLADKLIALDLPQRAGAVIQQMIAAMPPGSGQASLGARLATLRLSEGDAAGAAAALARTDAPELPAALQDERLMLEARIHALTQDNAGATAILARLNTAAADEMRATLLAEDGDWHGSALALDSAARSVLPDEGPLSPEQQDFVLHLISAHSRAGDEAALRALSERQGNRMTGGRADMFRLLTSAPVSHVSDLRRAGGEIAMARAIPSSLATVGSR